MRITVVEHEAEAGLGFFAGWLAGAGARCETARPYLGEPVPETPADGLVVLGGAASSWDDEGYPWLPATRDLIRRGVRDGVPTLGLCLGAQLMTLACGGRVERGGNGLEVGLCPVLPLPAAATDPLFRHVPGVPGGAAPAAVQYHRDAMTVLPAGAVPLVTGHAYPNQAYRLGESAWALQFHPEATPEIFVSWTADGADPLTAAGYHVDELNAQVKLAAEELARTWRPLAEAFAGVVADRRKNL
ncbi:aminotransferase [Microtetraspora sp. NBRC 13810]|uniref:type 1 glutamine amidotransferase n=1 Tax=Microtetraspora sp. NBRC 13810 TaxID=3030990 RepID=UPI00249FFDAA|nr:type 1 glutamine amidotransferase [Microtetraspora sp. NBRC 13810]GLW10598.1 aminotransferase [Microtetraspora sp. NBRC 13810]